MRACACVYYGLDVMSNATLTMRLLSVSGAYYCLNMIMITLSTFLSVIVINLYFRGDKRQKLPYFMKRVRISISLCMTSAYVNLCVQCRRH